MTTTVKETDYVDLRPQIASQNVYEQQEQFQQQAYYQQGYAQPQSPTAYPSMSDQSVYTPTLSPASSTTQTSQPAPAPIYVPSDRKNPGVAAVLSFFWAGLGQIYNGQVAKGIGFMVLYAFCVLLIFVLIGFILVPIVWIIGIVDAYNTAKQYNEEQLKNERAYYDSLRR